MREPLRVGNAQGFWGDSVDAPARLAEQQPDLDFLTLDYLAEVSMSIMAAQRQRRPEAGYARDFVDVVRSLVPIWRAGSKLRVITNAGGLNPAGCADACVAALREAGCAGLTIAVVTGDDILAEVQRRQAEGEVLDEFKHLDTGAPITTVFDRLVTANAYLGVTPVVEALGKGATVVITGRGTDPGLVVAPAVFHYGWKMTDYDRLAGATVAGHLIECGAQVTGGTATDWLDTPDPARIGFPVAEVYADGSCVITKPEGTGGCVTERTVKEQLLYEIGDPARYLSPDVAVSLMDVRVTQEARDHVRVTGAQGSSPPDSYKVSATYHDGYWAQGVLTIAGRDVVAKARRCGEIIRQRLCDAGFAPDAFNTECLGAGATAPGVLPEPTGLLETVLRVSVADSRREVIERFSKELAPLVTAGPQGTTGYAAGRPSVQPIYGYWPCLIQKDQVRPAVSVQTV